jgi:YrbI family 3-deoxy-D-manno-octulosonate 8-phosphate phosphatase
MTCVAIIPARGGSKGIPHKNICPVAGKPLLAYTIEHAKATPAIDRVIVSTDAPEIGAIATRYGAEVVWRPAEISHDTAASELALLHALDALAARDEACRPDLVVMLQATSPLRQAHDVQRAIETLLAEDADSLFSACTLHGFVWRREGDRHGRSSAGGAGAAVGTGAGTGAEAKAEAEASVWSVSYDYTARRMRQDSPEDLLENGSIYVTRHDLLRATRNRLGGKIAVYRMDPLDSLQVDDPEDLRTVERLLQARGAGAGAGEAMTSSPLSSPLTPPQLAGIDLLVLDFDGVLTDDRVLVDQDGREAVFCHRGDGWGIARLREAGVDIIVISTETNPVVTARCRKLQIDAIQSCQDKLPTLQQVARTRGVAASRIAYVGNDVNDLPCLGWVGTPIAVADAAPDVRAACRHVTSRPGGRGAVREVADWILAARQQPAHTSR